MRTIQCLNNSESSHKQSKAFPHKITKENSSNHHSPPLGYWIAMEFVPLILNVLQMQPICDLQISN